MLTRKQLPVKFRTKLTELGLKWCAGCKEVLELENFRISATALSGRAGKCLDCKPIKRSTDEAFDFSFNPNEFTLYRSIAALRRACKKQGLAVAAFGVAEVLNHFGLPRSHIPAVALIEPLDGFTLDNLKIDHTVLDQDNTNSQHKEKS